MRTILFIDKVFLRRRGGEPPRGVEVLNLNLMRDLVRLGYRVTVPVEASWVEPVRAFCGESAPELSVTPDCGVDFLTIWLAGFRAPKGSAATVLLGNVGKSLIPMMRWVRRRPWFRDAVLIAHREATPGFVRMMVSMPGAVVAVNGQIAEPFRRAGHPRVTVDYGVANAHLLYPADPPRRGDPVRFLVLGMLDNAWKGADTAVAAFRELPAPIRARCELHLASFTEPPTFPDPGIVSYPWKPVDEIPDFLRSMDAMVVPSRDEHVMRETFSQAIVQGMLTGLPILASSLPILVEKLDAGGGMMFNDTRELSKQMEQLIVDNGLRTRLGAEGRATALDRYVWDSARFADRYLGAPEREVDAPAT